LRYYRSAAIGLVVSVAVKVVLETTEQLVFDVSIVAEQGSSLDGGM